MSTTSSRDPQLTSDAPRHAFYPLVLGSVDVPGRAVHAGGPEDLVTVPLVAALVISPSGGAILIDNGFDDDVVPRIKTPHTLRPGALADALAEHGLTYDDVGQVINTHLHSDHAGMNKVFREAEIVVQEAEYRYALQPPTEHEYAYRPRSPFFDIPLARFRLAEGSIELEPGVWLVHTPGHTPGHQAVAVHTESGWLLFTGDACDDRSIWSGTSRPGILADEEQFLTSMELMHRLAAEPIFPHDLEFTRHELRDSY